MAEKAVGGCVVLLSFLLGGFLTLASFFAMAEGQDDFYLPLLLILGACMVAGGFVLMWKLVRPARRPEVEEEEGW